MTLGCCGKPRGCTQTHNDCRYLRHPWKRAVLHNDPTVRCPKASQQPHPDTGEWVVWLCVLLNGHEGLCDVRPGKLRP